MDALTAVVLVLAAALLVFVIMLGIVHQRGPLDPFGLRSARVDAARREALEAEDLEQMLALHNARRRARGQPQVTAADIEAEVFGDPPETTSRRDAWPAR